MIAIEWIYRVREGAALTQAQYYGAPLAAILVFGLTFVLKTQLRAVR